jgi:hypothetical protein
MAKLDKSKLDQIQQSYAAVGNDTKDKVLGSAFVVVDKDGISQPLHLAQLRY